VPESWRNWAGDQRCAPERIERPRSEQDLVRVVRGARSLRVAGSGHSFPDIACTDRVLVDLSGMDRVLALDRADVTVEAGITLRALGRELAARGLALESQGDIDAQTIAGAVSTGTHGTGGRFRGLAAGVVGMRLVAGTGEIVELRGDEELRAARVGLGALGAIAAVTLRCVPAFTIHRVDEPRPLDDVLPRLEALVDGADHFEAFAFPYTRTALTLTSQRGHDPPRPRSRVERALREVALENGLLGAAARLGRARPALIPAVNRLLVRLLARSERLDASHRVYPNERRVRFTEMEYAIPRAAAAGALERVLALIERRRLPVAFPIELRVVAPDDAFLSTAHGRPTAYIAVHQYRGMEFEGYFRAVEEIMDGLDGRPHWGKRHYQAAHTLAPRYPEWERFAAVRRRLDPDGRFENAYVRRVLGPVAG
jgi:FAD-linked oxidoreductase